MSAIDSKCEFSFVQYNKAGRFTATQELGEVAAEYEIATLLG